MDYLSLYIFIALLKSRLKNNSKHSNSYAIAMGNRLEFALAGVELLKVGYVRSS